MANKEKSPWLGVSRDLWVTLIPVVLSDVLGLGLLCICPIPNKWHALLWALACLGAGSLLGFLFAIPRAAVSRPEGTAASSYGLQANTNIEQISDWLTKLLVGAGLVELKSLPDALTRAAYYVATGLGPQPAAYASFAAALLIYFSVEGFFGAYLLTRIFFQLAFGRADRGLTGDVSPD